MRTSKQRSTFTAVDSISTHDNPRWTDKEGKTGKDLVSHLICSEAVVLAHQLAFYDKKEDPESYFIPLYAQHTMPRDLQAYLNDNTDKWKSEVVFG